MSKYAAYGTAQHEVMERAASHEPITDDDIRVIMRDAGVDAGDTERGFLTAQHVREYFSAFEHYKKLSTHVERPFAWDAITGAVRWLGPSRAGRDYSRKSDSEITGTLDYCIEPAEEGAADLLVYDLKTGRGARESHVVDSQQLFFYGMCMLMLHGAKSVQLVYVHADEHGIMDSDRYDLTAEAAKLFELRLAALVASVPASVPEPGWHCTGNWCPIAANCPATTKALAEIDTAATPSTPFYATIQSPEHAASVRHRLQMVKAATTHIEGLLKEYVRQHGPVPLGNGSFYGIKQAERETLDIAFPGAYKAAIKHLGPAVDKAVTISASKAGIVQAAGGAVQARPLLEELRAMGALYKTSYERLDEFKPKETK
jgi:hypothetical protein